MYIRGKYFYDKESAKEALDIRNKIFVEEMKIPYELVFDDHDELAVQALVYDEKDQPVAAGRIYFDGEDYLIGRIGVLPSARGKKIGDFLVRMLLDKAFIVGADRVIVHAQPHAIKFYEKIGFKSYGDMIMDLNMLHQPMQLKNGELLKECKGHQCNLP